MQGNQEASREGTKELPKFVHCDEYNTVSLADTTFHDELNSLPAEFFPTDFPTIFTLFFKRFRPRFQLTRAAEKYPDKSSYVRKYLIRITRKSPGFKAGLGRFRARFEYRIASNRDLPRIEVGLV